MNQRDQLVELVSNPDRFCMVFARWVERSKVGESDQLVNDLALSSLDMLYLLESIESLVSVELENEVLDDVTTVGDVRALLATLLAQSPGGRPSRRTR